MPCRVASLGIDPGLEVGRPQLGKRQQQIAQVALGIDGNGRHAVDRRLFQQRQAQPRLAAARHAHAHRVRRQVPRVVQHQLIHGGPLRQVVAPPQVEQAKLFEVLHRGQCEPARGQTFSNQSAERDEPAARRPLASQDTANPVKHRRVSGLENKKGPLMRQLRLALLDG